MTEAEAEGAPAPPPKRRRRRRWPWLLLALPVIALIALVAGLALLPHLLTPERLRQELVSAAREALLADFELASLDYDLSWGFVLKGLRVGPPRGFTRDVARVEAIELRYVPPWRSEGAVIVERFAIVRPELVLETRDGVKNVARLTRPSEAPPPPSEPSGPLSGPLSPLKVALRDVAIEHAKLELAGEGPELSIDDLDLRLDASIDPSRLDARLALTSTRARVTVQLPERSVKAGLDLGIVATLAADTRDGLALEALTLGAHLGLGGLAVDGLPELDLALDAAARLDGAGDGFTLSPLVLTLDHRQIARFGLEVDGVIAALLDASGDKTLAALLGLVPTARPGIVRLVGPGLRFELEPLMPLVRAFAPGVRLGGELSLSLDELRGRVSELKALRPERAKLALELARLSVSGPAELGGLDGAITAEARAGEPLRLGGELRGARVRSGPNTIEGLTLGLDGAIERPASYPATGTSSIALRLRLDEVRAPGAALKRLSARILLAGIDPLDAARATEPRVRVSLDATIDGVRAATGTVTRELERVTAKLDAALDRLLVPAERPIDASFALGLSGVRAPEAAVRSLALRGKLRLDDPRHARPLSLALEGAAELEALAARDAAIPGARWAVALRADGVDPTMRERLPARLSLDTTLEVPSLSLTAPRALTLPLRLELGADFQRAGARLTLRRLRAQAAEALDLAVEGRVDELLAPTPNLDLSLVLAPVPLSSPFFGAALGEPFEGGGTLGAKVKLRGRWTGADELVARLDAPPLTTTIELTSDELTAKLPARGLSVEGLDGSVSFELAAGRAGTRGALQLGRASSGAVRVEGLASLWELGLDEGVWRARLGLSAERLGDASAMVESARVDVDIAHPPFGDVDVRTFKVEAPGAGLDMKLEGKLARVRFGAVRPELSMSGAVDFERLRGALSAGGAPPAALKGLAGKLGFELGTHAPRPGALSVEGALTLEDFAFSDGATRVVGARGRVPFSQLLLLGEPSDAQLPDRADARGPLAESWLGLSASLRELAETLGRSSRVVLSSGDVLVVAPRTADYEPLRPYYRAPSTARLEIAAVDSANLELRAMSMDLGYRSGVLRLDRFATRLWDGDIYGDMAVQIADQDHLRLRLRSTLTNLNLDVPVAVATGRARVTGEERDQYLVSGNIDLRMDLRDRTMDGYFDFTKMGSKALVTLIDAMDPTGKDKSLQKTRASLSSAATLAFLSARFTGTTMSIRNNLLDMDFIWDYQPFELPWVFTGILPISRLILGPIVMNSLQPLDDYPLSAYLGGPWVKNLNQSVFKEALRGRLVVGDPELLAAEAPR